MAGAEGLKVLFYRCDDSLARAVGDGGHRASAAATEAAAVNDTRDGGPDVVVLDADGGLEPTLDLAGRIRAASQWRKPLFLVLSDAISDGLIARCRAAGIDLLLVKPVPPGQLTRFLDRMRSVVESYESFDPVI